MSATAASMRDESSVERRGRHGKVSKLDDYLAGEFAELDRERQDIDKLIERTLVALEKLFNPDCGWPYQVVQGSEVILPPSPSASTVAMIGSSLAATIGRSQDGILSRHLDWQPERRPRKAVANEKTACVAKAALSLLYVSAATSEQKPHVFYSSTFGADDVFTLSWLLDLASAGLDPLGLQRSDAVRASENGQLGSQSGLGNRPQLFRVLHRVLDHRPYLDEESPDTFKARSFSVRGNGTDELKPEKSEHAFPLLRALQIKLWASVESKKLDKLRGELGDAEREQVVNCRDLARRLGQIRPDLWQAEFSQRVHEQLSFHAIPDSRFDPAELAFSLEGLALARPTALDRAVVKRGVGVLASEQERNPTLRPARPLRSEPNGKAHLPVSVEIFNSLLRLEAVIRPILGPDLMRPELVALCRRYYAWLAPRLVDGAPDREDLYGWHSEHINDPAVVHPWETSQVLVFLLGYRTLLDQHLAAGSRSAAGLSVRYPKPRPSTSDIKNRWAKLVHEREPVTTRLESQDGPDLRIFEAIQRDFVQGYADRRPVNYSMILYGPPGTGKTSIAEELADALGYPLITVTVSDFLAEGGLQIEARAKAVFMALSAQKRSVILFDEIDHLLLDRNSGQYKTVDSSIQLLVPGMLTKIKDLRSAQRSILIIATNYEDRIDGAIKRPGRIDRKYLVMPPDAGRRATIVRSVLEDYSKEVRSIGAELIKSVARNPVVLKSTARMSYPEMRAVLLDAIGREEDVLSVESFTRYQYPDPVANDSDYDGRKETKLLREERSALQRISEENVETDDVQGGQTLAGRSETAPGDRTQPGDGA
jgi:hypothetical protein